MYRKGKGREGELDARCRACRQQAISSQWWAGVPRLPPGAIALLREQDSIFGLFIDLNVHSGGLQFTQECNAVIEIDPSTVAIRLDSAAVRQAGALAGRCALLAVSSVCQQYAIVHGTLTMMRADELDDTVRGRLGGSACMHDSRLVAILDVEMFAASVCRRVQSASSGASGTPRSRGTSAASKKSS